MIAVCYKIIGGHEYTLWNTRKGFGVKARDKHVYSATVYNKTDASMWLLVLAG